MSDRPTPEQRAEWGQMAKRASGECGWRPEDVNEDRLRTLGAVVVPALLAEVARLEGERERNLAELQSGYAVNDSLRSALAEAERERDEARANLALVKRDTFFRRECVGHGEYVASLSGCPTCSPWVNCDGLPKTPHDPIGIHKSKPCPLCESLSALAEAEATVRFLDSALAARSRDEEIEAMKRETDRLASALAARSTWLPVASTGACRTTHNACDCVLEQLGELRSALAARDAEVEEAKRKAFEDGLNSCLHHRCPPHYAVPRYNESEPTGAECGACIAATKDAELAEAVEAAGVVLESSYRWDGHHYLCVECGELLEDCNRDISCRYTRLRNFVNSRPAPASAPKGEEGGR